MKKTVFLVIGVIIASILFAQLGQYLRDFNDYKGVYCSFSVNGQPNPDLYMAICPTFQRVATLMWNLADALNFVAVYFSSLLLKNRQWIKWTCIVGVVVSFLPNPSDILGFVDWKMYQRVHFLETHLPLILLCVVIVLSLISLDRRVNGIITRFFTQLTEPA